MASAVEPKQSKFVEVVTGTIQVPVLNRQGEAAGTIDVDPAEFGGRINKQLLHDVVLMYLANQRLGTHSTLRRGEVAGSTKKLFRQKGTGNARVGSRRTNKRRGGGTTKGPKPRDYSYSLPKKAMRAALRMAILGKLRDQEVVVVEDYALPAPKTKEMAGLLKALKLAGATCLIGTPELDVGVFRAGRNIEGVEVLPVRQFHTYAVLKPKRVLLSRAAFDALRKPAPAPTATA
jgi:large subunit ribosomal protein L4